MELNDILSVALKARASDIHLKAGLPPIFRIDGALRPLPKAPRIGPDVTEKIAHDIMSERQRLRFAEVHEVDLAYGVPGLGRFRVNAFSQRGSVTLVFRAIPFEIKGVDELLLPPVLEKISEEQRGLVLVTGTTGSGKSTTLASMIDYINARRIEHVMTIEDPIEFLHRDKKSIINQREVEVDTRGFSVALRSALRQDPDVILVGEMRDYETIETALLAAETGHLVLSTLHTLDATRPEPDHRGAPPQQKQIRIQCRRHQGDRLPAPRPPGRRQGAGPGHRAHGRHRPHPGIDRRQGEDQAAARGDPAGLYRLWHADLRPVPDGTVQAQPHHL
jgi:twitching motility protein PilT